MDEPIKHEPLKFDGERSTGFYRPDADTEAFVVDGVEIERWNVSKPVPDRVQAVIRRIHAGEA
jgi:hypothetical protein